MEAFHKAMKLFRVVQSAKSLISVIADLILSILFPTLEPRPIKAIFKLSSFNLQYLFAL